jgi:hypothetical protein
LKAWWRSDVLGFHSLLESITIDPEGTGAPGTALLGDLVDAAGQEGDLVDAPGYWADEGAENALGYAL